jgi:hypothetical protein
MLGWGIYIYRQVPDEPWDKPTEESLIATWTAGLGGLDWITALVRQGKAVDHGGDGYPDLYTAAAKDILPRISGGPPPHKGPFVIGDDYVAPSGWTGAVKIDHAKIEACSPDEQLTIVAWDQS